MKLLKSFLLPALLCMSIYVHTQDTDIQALLNRAVDKKTVIGVIAGYSIDGETKELSVAGYANKKSNKEFSTDTKVRMGSIAKPMTAIAIMQNVEKGLIDLDVPIQTYIPEYPEQVKTQITTRHLLSHTSGIGGYKNGKESNTTKDYTNLTEALSLFQDRPLMFEPGTRYSYTTYGYTVLGVILERVSNLSYEQYMQENIFVRAGMDQTGIEKYQEMIDNESLLYTRNNGKGKAKLAKENNLSNRYPAGGFYTTAGDMLKFGQAVINNLLVSEQTLDLMRQHHSLEKENNSYGFGWFLYNPKRNVGDIMGHSGAQTGCTSFLFVVPKMKITCIILSNTSRAQSDIDPIANALLSRAISKAKE